VLNAKKVKELMLPLSKYPHVPESASIREAIEEIRRASGNSGGKFRFRTLLVLDDKWRLAGIVSIEGLLGALEPDFVQKPPVMEGYSPKTDPGLSEAFAGVFVEKWKQNSKKPIKDVISRANAAVGPEDTVAKALHLMLNTGQGVLPVIVPFNDDGRVVGALRMLDAFDEVMNTIIG